VNAFARPGSARRLRVLTWHVHGNYLYYLTQVPHDFYLVTDAARSPHHTGRSGTLPWGDNVHQAPLARLREMPFDVVLFQSRAEWEAADRTLGAALLRLPRIYLEHDPPQAHPTDTQHWVDDRGTLLVHVTAFNALMWDAGRTPVRVIEHGVKLLEEAHYTGTRQSGIVVVNNLDLRGRRLGHDVYQQVRRSVPLELVGMGSERCGGLGEIENSRLPGRVAEHRFFFNPIRYTSLGLAVIEAMMVGTPVVGLATTELATVIRNQHDGIIDTRLGALEAEMRALLRDPARARELGEAGRRNARERFHIDRFVADWCAAFAEVSR
jgi:glycosyltransferase involved in cell wall biosynthesis